MEKPIEHYWNIRIQRTKAALEANNFEVFVVDSTTDAKRLVLETILPQSGAQSLSWGGSLTISQIGLFEVFTKELPLQVINVDEPTVPWDILLERRRQALLADVFFTGTNALTETGQLVNLDAVGNRVGGITFGPQNVVVLAGRNKIVPDVEAARTRIKQFVAPANSMRLGFKTPCVTTANCVECKSPGRICNVWTITEKSAPPGRIKVVIINQDLGL
jgi:L-lactate utilization protein LutB